MSMECNKDEALRAKEIAEKKMNDNDFAGARRVALKAQRLFPELENISQLLTVCDVHCSAENRILGTEKDWYSILQIEKIADEATIKKQYRKLALALHPDKNKFPGAEAAFKIIGEAHLLLSDRSKRAFYDSKVGVAVKSAQPKPPSYNKPPARKQSAARNNDANGFSSQFNGQNHHQATQQNCTAIKLPFWTCCPYCNIKYQFYREVQNKNLRCQKCQKVFVAYEIAAQGGPSLFKTQAAAQGMPGSFMSQTAAQGVPGSNKSHTAAQGMPGSFMNQAAAQGMAGSHKSWAAAPGVPSAFKQSPPTFWKSKDVPTQGIDSTFGLKTGGTVLSNLGAQGNASSGPVRSVSGTQRRRNLDPKAKHRERGTTMPKDVKLPNETDLRNKNKKRGMKSETESSESSGMSDDSIMEDTVAGVDTSGFVRRSNRQKHQVSYKENVVDDDDFESPPKRPRKEESSHGEGGGPDGDADGNFAKPLEKKETVSAKESFTIGQNMNNKVAEEPGVVDVSESDDDDDDDSGGRFFDYPEPEFNDFDKLRGERLFAADQFWACYGDGDGMPRFYAQIKVVQSSPFKVRITWLEPNPDDEGEIEWAVKGLPIACGKFKRGNSQNETNIGIFSHQLVCEKGKQRGSLMVYPRKGETWALFKNWDMGWRSNPDEHKNSEYEIVEVLSNFVEGVGVEVALLERLRGFVSLFQCGSQKRAETVLLPATEMFRFSHRIPSFKMSGTEKDGVPEGSFELDPASLPANYVAVCHRPVSGADDDNTKVEGNCSNEESSKMEKPNLSVGEQTPKKSTELVGEGSKHRRSSRGQNVVEVNRHSNAKESRNESSQSESVVSTGQDDRKVDKEVHEARKSSWIDHSLYPGRKVSEYMLHDFKDRPEEKFETNQIWALYEPEQRLPKLYGLIKRIEHSPFRLHVAALGSISAPENGQHPVCGTFMVKHGKPRAFELSAFSHLMEATLTGKNRYSIYPKVGEVWGLYRSWTSELTSSDLKNCECILVEIIDVSQGSTKVSVLVPMTPRSNKKLFRSPRKQSGPELIEIQGKELGRFSHPVPAILQGEGSWLVDSAAVPKSPVSGK